MRRESVLQVVAPMCRFEVLMPIYCLLQTAQFSPGTQEWIIVGSVPIV